MDCAHLRGVFTITVILYQSLKKIHSEEIEGHPQFYLLIS